MPATTWKGDVERDAKRLLNSRFVVPLGGGNLAGTNPKNPIQAGLGMRIAVLGSNTISAVLGQIFYMHQDSDLPGQPLPFVQVTETLWLAEGAAGGTRLGFPPGLDYDTPQPFELEIRVVYQGGVLTRRYGFWVGNGEGFGCEECHQREGFAVEWLNCCLANHGFRFSNTESGGDLFSSFNNDEGEGGEFDIFFSTDLGSSFTWGVGVSGVAGGDHLETVCNDPLNDAEQFAYIPDWISGATSTPPKPDDPFVLPVVPRVIRTRAQQLDSNTALSTVLDGTVAQYGGGVIGTDTGPLGPASPDVLGNTVDGNYPAGAPPILPTGAGFKRLDGVGHRAPRPPTTNLVVRKLLQAAWVGSGVGGDGNLSLALADASTALQLTVTNLNAGETVYFVVSSARMLWTGPETGVGATQLPAPYLGMTELYLSTPTVEPRATQDGAGGPVVGVLPPWDAESNYRLWLVPASASPGGTAVSPALLANTVWSVNSIGGALNLGGATGATVQVAADLTYLGTALTAWAGASPADQPLTLFPLFVQGIVLPPGTAPLAGPAVTPVGQFGVQWPYGAVLTAPAMLLVGA